MSKFGRTEAFGPSPAPRSTNRLTAVGSLICVSVYFACGSVVRAQDTVYIGGTGKPSVEVNLDALNDMYGGGDGRQLLHPWEKPRYILRTSRSLSDQEVIRVPASRVQALTAPAAVAAPPPTTTLGARPSSPATTATPRLVAPPPARLPQQPSAASPGGAPVPLTPLPSRSAAGRGSQDRPTPLPSVRDQERLAELAALRDENLISPEDYAAKREEITAAKPDQARLAELAALRDEDLISPKDYAAKRDQILGKAPPATELPPVTTAPAKPAVSVTPAAPAAPAAKEAPKAPPVQKAKPKPAATAPIPIPGAEKPKAETAEKPAVPAPAKTATPAPEATPAPAPTPTPAKAAPAPAKKETKVAALPKRLPSTGTPQLQLDFNNSTATLSPSQVEQVKQLAGRLKEGTDRVQVRAYAGATGEDTGSARRASLKRALAVRSRLIEGGIRSTRVDVRALGVADDGGPADRVDIFTAAR